MRKFLPPTPPATLAKEEEEEEDEDCELNPEDDCDEQPTAMVADEEDAEGTTNSRNQEALVTML